MCACVCNVRSKPGSSQKNILEVKTIRYIITSGQISTNRKIQQAHSYKS